MVALSFPWPFASHDAMDAIVAPDPSPAIPDFQRPIPQARVSRQRLPRLKIPQGQASARLPYGRIALEALGIWLAVRVVFALVTYLALISIQPNNTNTLADLFTHWNQWDVQWYTTIASSGYTNPIQAAFFPLFPLMIRGAMIFAGAGQAFLAGVIVANIMAYFAFYGLGLLAASVVNRPSAGSRAILAMAAYPFAFFLATSYTEAPFLAFAIFAVFFARRGRWLPAALLAFLATLTRSDGLLLVLPLGWEYLRQHVDQQALRAWLLAFRDVRHPRALRAALQRRRTALRLAFRPLLSGERVAMLAGVLVAAPAAVGVYMLYLWIRFGQPLAFFTAEHKNPQWGRQTMPLWQTGQLVGSQLATYGPGSWAQSQVLLDVVPVVVVLVITLLAIRKMPCSLTLYTLAVVYYAIAAPAPAMVSVLMSARRVMLGAFPVFVQLGRWMERRPWLQTLVVGGGFALETIMIITFLSGQWAG